MLSNTPLTDFIFKNISLNPINQSEVEIGDVSPYEARQMSYVSALSYLIRSNVPLSDLEEMVIRIGVKEVRNFLGIQALSFIVMYFH
jgi:hypothetical protein